MRVSAHSPLLAALVLSSACSPPAPDTPAPPAAERAVTAPAAPRAVFRISSVSPEELTTRFDRVAEQTLSVSYSIPDPATVTEAELRLYLREVGDIAEQKFKPVADGVVELSIKPVAHSIGSTVRFRASCPGGVTDWFTLGQIPPELRERLRTDVLQITVMPDSIPWREDMDQPNAGRRITVWGPALTPDCHVEAQVDGSPVALENVRFTGKGFEGLLMLRDINFHSITPRYAELKLEINRAGRRTLATQRIPFK